MLQKKAHDSSFHFFSKRVKVVRELEWKETLGRDQDILVENFLKVLQNASLDQLNEYVDSYSFLINKKRGGASSGVEALFHEARVDLEYFDDPYEVDFRSEGINSIYYKPFVEKAIISS